MVSGNKCSEGYAYLWNTKRFRLLEYTKMGNTEAFQPHIINSREVNADCSFLARTPYYIRLQPLRGGFWELRLINIHIYHGGNDTQENINLRKEEFQFLTQTIYPKICERRDGQNRAAYTIAMGDYNLNILSPVQTQNKNCYLTEVHTYHKGKEDVQILTVQKQLTTLRQEDGYANNFDHFTYSPALSKFVKVSYETIDAVQKYCGGDFAYYRKNISDHLPIVMTVKI